MSVQIVEIIVVIRPNKQCYYHYLNVMFESLLPSFICEQLKTKAARLRVSC